MKVSEVVKIAECDEQAVRRSGIYITDDGDVDAGSVLRTFGARNGVNVDGGSDRTSQAIEELRNRVSSMGSAVYEGSMFYQYCSMCFEVDSFIYESTCDDALLSCVKKQTSLPVIGISSSSWSWNVEVDNHQALVGVSAEHVAAWLYLRHIRYGHNCTGSLTAQDVMNAPCKFINMHEFYNGKLQGTLSALLRSPKLPTKHIDIDATILDKNGNMVAIVEESTNVIKSIEMSRRVSRIFDVPVIRIVPSLLNDTYHIEVFETMVQSAKPTYTSVNDLVNTYLMPKLM